MGELDRPPAIVMNMFYTGLGIARSLGERGIPVIGLTSQPGIYGNFTRYAKTIFCPDSRREPERLLPWLLEFGRGLGRKGVIFPTRDDDVIFLDRFRRELERYFILTIPPGNVVKICLDKWETYLSAKAADVLTPRCWLIGDTRDLDRAIREATFPCVLKPVSSHDWRVGQNWELVGARKAIGISSADELPRAYAEVARANQHALLQEMVPGGDDCLVIAACYLDRKSQFMAGFNTQKLVQCPEGFGTGCIVQSANRPELFEPAGRLLRAIGFTGVAEVEFKWDATKRQYQLIEINPRLWDQHRLGKACGVDLAVIAYYDCAGLGSSASPERRFQVRKWIAEDVFCMNALRLLWNRDQGFWKLLRAARGKRMFAVWSIRDPLPSVAYLLVSYLPEVFRTGARALWSSLKGLLLRRAGKQRGLMYGKRLENDKTLG